MQFNQKGLESIEFSGNRKPIPDPRQKGLYLRFNSAGSKAWYLRYWMRSSNANAKERWLKIDDFENLKLFEARGRAREYLAMVAKGIDPAEELRKVAPVGYTVADACNRFMAEYAPANLEPQSIDSYRVVIRKYIVPNRGKILIKDLDRNAVASWHSSVTTFKTQMNRALGTLSSICTQTEIWGWRPQGTNPCRYVKRKPETPRKRDVHPNELEAIGAALKQLEGRCSPWALAAVKVVALCAGRVSEVLSLRYDQDLYLDEGFALLRKHKTSKDAGSKRLELPPAAVKIIRDLPRHKGSQWVFPSRNPETALARDSLHKTWALVRRLAGVKDLTQHDFRAVLAAEAHYQGIDVQTTSKVLGHKSSKTTVRHYLNVRSSKVTEAVAIASRPLVKAFGLDEPEEGESQD